MLKKYGALLIILVIITLSCEQEGADIGVNGTEKFIGEYEIESNHISGIQTFYDSVGNVISQGYDTATISNELLLITQAEDKDTLLIANLINHFDDSRAEVKAILIDDTVRIVHDLTMGSTTNNYIKGNIWLKEDSIFLNYIWNRSDTWSSGALPEAGTVKGKGIFIQ